MNKKVIIYQMPLFERIMGIYSAVILTAIPIICLIIGVEKIFETIILLFAVIAYCIFIYFIAFKTYIHLVSIIRN